MKRMFTLFCFAAFGLTANAQRLLVEDFNYATGELTDANGANVGGGNWTSFSGTGNYLFVRAGNLKYPGYFTSPAANSNKLSTRAHPTSSEDVYRGFTPQTSGTVYCTYLTKIDTIYKLASHTSTGEYSMAFLPSTNTSDFRARVLVRKGVAPNTVNFGINTTSTTATNPVNQPVWATNDYNSGVVHLITFAYQFVAGANNDIAKLWVNKPFSSTEPAPDAIATFPAVPAAEGADIARVAIRQAAFNTPDADIDAIVVATNYADVSLPLNLTSFKAVFSGRATQVKWTTDNEVNIAGFSIEKSLDGTNFSQFEYVSGRNNGSQNVYTLEDNKVKGGITYYRLKQVDRNGDYKYSGIVAVKNNSIIKAEVFPNPTKGNLTVSHDEAITGAAITVLNLEGKQVKSYKVQAGATKTALVVSDLVKGNYIVVFENNGSKSVTQFTKQ